MPTIYPHLSSIYPQYTRNITTYGPGPGPQRAWPCELRPRPIPSYTHHIATIYPPYSHNIPTIYPQYSHYIPTIYPPYTHYITTIYPQYIHINPQYIHIY